MCLPNKGFISFLIVPGKTVEIIITIFEPYLSFAIPPIKAPIKKGDNLGKINVYVNDEFKEEANILAKEDVKRANIFSRIFMSFNYLVWGDV